MKKLSSRQKIFLLKKSIEYTERKKNRKFKIYKPGPRTGYYSKKSSKRSQVNRIAPPVFNLKFENCKEVIEFINELKSIGRRGKDIHIVLDNVSDFGEGAIAMLLSVIKELGRMGIRVEGTMPANADARSTLERSGFFSHIAINSSLKNVSLKNSILTTGFKRTPHSRIAKEVRNAIETVWNTPSRCPLLYGGIIEMVRNSCDHAFANDKEITWHLSLSHIEEQNLVKFSFVDNGHGILKTFSKGILKTVISYFEDQPDLINTAFLDGIESRTGLSWRGKGLPTVYEMFSENLIKNFIVITNNVYIDFAKNIKVTLPVNYSGTYYYWEMDTNCEKLYFE